MKLKVLTYISILLTSCTSTTKHGAKEFPACKTGLMGPGIYELGACTSIPKISTSEHAFSIIIDTSYKAINYKPYFLEAIKNVRKIDATEFKERFNVFNDGKQIVWLINGTSRTVALQTAGFDLIAILQAKDLNNVWKPIEYMRPVLDNFQYDYIRIPPNKASFFKVELPNRGDFETTFRYKILGRQEFLYSPEFIGRIDHCKFSQDTTQTGRKQFMLDEFYNNVD